MRILLLGSGGRESALAWKISQSDKVEKLYIAPGNDGTSAYGINLSLSPLDFASIETFASDNKIDMIVVGNEDPLVEGLTDYFKGKNILVVGPSKDGAALEGSKDFAKRFMKRHGIPTAKYESFTIENIDEAFRFLEKNTSPYVLKADGLAAGKGVLIVDTLEDAKQSLKTMLKGQFGESSKTVVIEEFLSGIECSVFVLTDGKGNYHLLPVAKDYKRIGEGDTGPNTGGMGSISPVPFADGDFMNKVVKRIIEPTLHGLIKDGIDYRGFIFFGLINVEGNPYVIEYNVRMGDPETESVMLRISNDLVPLLKATAQGNLNGTFIDISPKAAATVIAVSAGYPGSYEKGHPISFPDSLPEGTIVFHAGTKNSDGVTVTSGGRVLAISTLADTVEDALNQDYSVLEQIKFKGLNYRKDIGFDIL